MTAASSNDDEQIVAINVTPLVDITLVKGNGIEKFALNIQRPENSAGRGDGNPTP